jgi:hypothetical protein
MLPPPGLEDHEVRRWYGGYTLMTDGIALASAIAGGLTEPGGEPLFWVAGGGYLFGAPIVHLVHGNPGRAAASLGLRVGLPIAFVGVGLAVEDCEGRDFCGFASVLIGLPLGMATAIALDAAVLARDRVKRQVRITPVADVGTDHASIGLHGTF